MDAAIEGEVGLTPNRTPFYRVLPVEKPLPGKRNRLTWIKRSAIPDGAAAGYRLRDGKSRAARGGGGLLPPRRSQDCRQRLRPSAGDMPHLQRTCRDAFEAGLARRIDHAEALQILQDCERRGSSILWITREGSARCATAAPARAFF